MKHDDEMTKELASELADYVKDCFDGISIAEYSKASLINITENYLRSYAEHMWATRLEAAWKRIDKLEFDAIGYVERIVDLEAEIQNLIDDAAGEDI